MVDAVVSEIRIGCENARRDRPLLSRGVSIGTPSIGIGIGIGIGMILFE
jgi:hypothetical protein